MNAIIGKYKDKCFKLTPQRITILEYLDGNTDHPTADDIYREIRKKHPRVSFATVYNTIEALKDRGEITELTIDPERRHYDPNTEPHHHVVCTSCNKIGDVFVDYAKQLGLGELMLEGFSVTGADVNFYGVCSDCEK